ncbi:hypothetical protein IGI82_003722 [Enterococcus sp. AZ067]|uniref:plasmid mobilization protein n=1 Tax=Enterococcus sp. AZ067 TaxID=2774674 RepID=UPI00157483CC|nr:plasmid mobilization relaxosome protein MobC [Enterococcus faecalis]
MTKKANRYRSEPILLMVTPEERKQIIMNKQVAGLGTMSNYIRLMALNGRVIKIDFTSLKESLAETGKYVYELNKIGNNINQIAHKLNQTDIVEKEDVEYLVSEFVKIQSNYIKAQEVLLQEIQKLTRSE